MKIREEAVDAGADSRLPAAVPRGHGKGKAGTKMLVAHSTDAIASNPIAFKLANMAAYELRSHIEGLIGSWTGRKGQNAGPPRQVSVRPQSREARRPTSEQPHPRPQGCVFSAEINKQEVAHFLECSGLKSSTTVFEPEEGGMNHRVHKLPGQSRWRTSRFGTG